MEPTITFAVRVTAPWGETHTQVYTQSEVDEMRANGWQVEILGRIGQ